MVQAPEFPPEDADPLLLGLLGALLAEDLQDSAEAFKKEVQFSDCDAVLTPEKAVEALVECASLHTDEAALLRHSLQGAQDPTMTGLHPVFAMTHSACHFEDTRTRMSRLHTQFVALKSRGKRTSSALDVVDGTIQLHEASLTALQRSLEECSAREAALNKRLQSARDEAELLKAQAMLRAVERPAAKIRSLLERWEFDRGLREELHHCFAQVDVDGNGMLTWNNSEIRRFARGVFEHLGIAFPAWDDPRWYGLYRQCDADNSGSLEMHEAISYSRLCLEALLDELEPLDISPSGAEMTSVAAAVRGAMADMQDGSLELRCRELFERASAGKPDARISWETGQVKNVLIDIFELYGVTMPSWPTMVWQELSRASDVDLRQPLKFDAVYRLAAHCLQLRGFEAGLEDVEDF
eukprot:TRINITY_DN65724_c0_g1_i1.p1 TRINITY_DN65724_c0_g1~~TRINITY_DN65724_c0_g1_i1.p1  ORF type:complete len:410 (-),score=87.53 TRINITY_DN65724_c0_g1_i1:188-1417(-)